LIQVTASIDNGEFGATPAAHNVTEHPAAQWTAQQLVEAFPFDSAARYLLRDRDAIYGEKVRRRIKSLGIEEVVAAPRSPWQNPFVERKRPRKRPLRRFARRCLEFVYKDV